MSDIQISVGVVDTAAAIAELRKISAATQQMADKTTQSAEKQQSAWSGLGKAVAGVFAVSKIAEFGKQAIANAAALEQNRIAFQNFTGSVSKGNKVLAEVQRFAAETPFKLPELVDSTKKLLAFGVGAEDVKETLRRLGDVAAGTGAPVNELAELYGKAKVQGRLFAEDMNQFQGRGIPIMQALADITGKSTGEVRKLVEQGKIGFPELEKAFEKITGAGSQFGGLMAKQAQTSAGVWSTFTDNIEQAAASIAAEFLPMANKVLSWFNSFFDAGESEVAVLQRQKTELQIYAATLQDANAPMAVRNDALKKAQEIQPEFLKGLTAESASYEDIAKSLALANKEFERQQYLAIRNELVKGQQEQIAEGARKQAKAVQVLAATWTGFLNDADPYWQEFDENIRQGIQKQARAIDALPEGLEKTRKKVELISSFYRGIGDKAQAETLAGFGEGDRMIKEAQTTIQSSISAIDAAFGDLNKSVYGTESATKAAGVSLEQLKGNLKALQDQYEKATSSAQRANLAGQIEALKAQIRAIEQGVASGSIVAMKEQLKALQEQYDKTGSSAQRAELFPKIETIKAQIKELESGAEFFKKLRESVNFSAIEFSFDENSITESGKQVSDGLLDPIPTATERAMQQAAEIAARQAQTIYDPIGDAGRKAAADMEEGIAAANKRNAEEMAANIKAMADGIQGMAGYAMDAISIINDFGEAATLRQLSAIDAAREAALSSDKLTAEQRAALEAKFDKQREAIEKKAGERRKRQALAEAVVNGAVAFTRALASSSPPLNAILAGIVALQTAGQVALINAQQFAEGGWVRGGKPGKDSVPAWMMPGEFVMPVKPAQQFAPILEAMRGGASLPELLSIMLARAGGGGVSLKPLAAAFGSGTERIVQAISNTNKKGRYALPR